METTAAMGPPATSARRDVWIAAGAYLVCGLAWLALEFATGAFRYAGTARALIGLFVVVNGPALIVLILPGRYTAMLLLAFAAALAILSLVFAFAAPAYGLAVPSIRFAFPIVFVVLAFLAWRAVIACTRPPTPA